MRILHFKGTMNLQEGGVVKAVLDLVRMSASSDTVGLASVDASGLPEDWASGLPITIHELPGDVARAGLLTRSQLNELEEIIDGYDVVHLHSMWPTSNPQIAKLCRGMGKPYILSVHGMLDDWCMSQRRLKKIAYMKTWGRNLLRDASYIHCTAQAELDQASAWFEHAKGVVIPLPFDLSEYETLPGDELAHETFDKLDPDLPKVLFLSRIHYKKGVDRLIQASAILAERGVKHQLVIAGTGEDQYVKQMRSLAEQVGASGHTYFLGFASGMPKVSLLQACDLFALPTSQENFGFVFFEALAAGTLVLTTKGTDTWPEIESSGGGVIAANTPQDFADQLEMLLSDPQRLKEMGNAGRSWVHKEMAVERTSAAYAQMYQGCLDVSRTRTESDT